VREPKRITLRLVLLLPMLLLVGLTLAGDRPVREVPVEEAGYEPYLRFVPTHPSGRLDWLLVTPANLVEAFEPLVRHRRDLGLAADVVTVEEVRRDVLLGGGDLPERLRNLVRRLHARYGLRYLLLGGDSGVLPSRMLPFGLKGPKVHHGEPYAGDGYFGCLDGEWNADADARFGEAEPGQRDRPDVTHEVHVGRVPVESPREVETWVRKLLLYERPAHVDYQGSVAYLGGKVFVEKDADTFYRKLHADRFGPAGFEGRFFTVTGEGSRAADVFAHLSAGVGVVCHYHHSFSYNLSLPQGAIDTGNAGEIANAERPFVAFSNGCYANQFTKEGISEKLLLSPRGGAVAFVGSTNTNFSTSLGLEVRFWEAVFERGATLGEAMSAVRGSVPQDVGVLGFLRLSFNLLGDPATRVWPGAPTRIEVAAKGEKGGGIVVTRKPVTPGPVWVVAHQPGALGAWRDAVPFPEGKDAVRLPPAIGNGGPLRMTAFGPGVVPSTVEIGDPSPLRRTGVAVEGRKLATRLSDGRVQTVPLPESPEPGPIVVDREIDGAGLRMVAHVLDGADVAFLRDGVEVRLPGFRRLGAPREAGLPVLAPGDVDAVAGDEGPAPELEIEVESTSDSIRLGWTGEPGARWLVEREEAGGRRLLTPVPLVNPIFELTGLPPLETVSLVVSRLGRPGRTRVEASTRFAYQAGFPQRIGSNVTSVQVLDLDGRRGKEVLFGDDRLGLWALHADGSEVRHAGDSWTFGLFAAIESGVFEPVVANLTGSRAPEILATAKLKNRKLYAFRRDGEPLPGFPVAIRGRLMTPPLVGDFDGKRGNEILVVSGFGKTIDLIRPDGTREPFAEIGQYNYAYPIAVNLDRDRALEVVVLDGAGKVWALDQGGKTMKGFPVDLGGPGRATPMVANLDRDRGLEIVAVGKGTTRLVVIDARTGKVQADLAIPGAGAPADHSFFYPGLARLEGKTPSIVVGTPSKKLFALDLVRGESLEVRKGFPIDLGAEARGVAAVDVDDDGRDELFLSLHDGRVLGLDAEGKSLRGFPLVTGADTYAVPLLEDLDDDGDLELFLGAADGVLRVWDLPYRIGRRTPTWRGLLNGAGMPGRPGKAR
jgi:hypothetical protein